MQNDKLKHDIILLLCNHLGLEVDDVSEDDSLKEDLRMGPTVLTDFVEALSQGGYDTTKIDLERVETVGDLIDSLELYT